MVAVVGLTGAIVILANDLDEVSNPTAAKPLASVNQPGSARYDGGPEEGTRGIGSLAAPSAPDEPHRPGLGDRLAPATREQARGPSVRRTLLLWAG